MEQASDLPAAVTRRAALEAEQPCLFFRPRRAWRWHPCEWWAGGMTSAAGQLANLAPQTRIGFFYQLDPENLVADLAIQAAGLVSAPVTQSSGGAEDIGWQAKDRGCAAWLPQESEGDPPPGAATLPGLRIDDGAGFAAPSLESPGEPGGVLVGRSGAWQQLAPRTLLDAAMELGSRVERIRGPEVVLSRAPLESVEGRLLVAWTIQGGGVLLLEPWAERLAETVFWSRPTVLQLCRREAEGLTRSLVQLATGRRGAAGLRRRFRRFHTILLPAGQEVPEAMRSFWEELEVEVRTFPLPSQASPLEARFDGGEPR